MVVKPESVSGLVIPRPRQRASVDFDHLATAVIASGTDAARALARGLAVAPAVRSRATPVTCALAAQTYLRDHFTCRYCGRETCLAAVLELLARIFRDEIPFVSHHYPAGVTHPAFTTLTASIDHVQPVSHGGSSGAENLVTACWPCNQGKGELPLDFLGWEIRPIIDSSWRGLTQHYAALWDIAGRPNPALHSRWMKALDISPG